MRLVVPGQERSKQKRCSNDTMRRNTAPSELTVQCLDARGLARRGSRGRIISLPICGTSMGCELGASRAKHLVDW